MIQANVHSPTSAGLAAADTGEIVMPRIDWHSLAESGHFAQFYETDHFLLHALGDFIGTGLRAGGRAWSGAGDGDDDDGADRRRWAQGRRLLAGGGAGAAAPGLAALRAGESSASPSAGRQPPRAAVKKASSRSMARR